MIWLKFLDMEKSARMNDFKRQIKDDLSKTVCCCNDRIEDIKRKLENAGVPVWVALGNNREVIIALLALLPH